MAHTETLASSWLCHPNTGSIGESCWFCLPPTVFWVYPQSHHFSPSSLLLLESRLYPSPSWVISMPSSLAIWLLPWPTAVRRKHQTYIESWILLLRVPPVPSQALQSEIRTFFLPRPCSMWDLSYLTRNRSCALDSGRLSLNHWFAREVLEIRTLKCLHAMFLMTFLTSCAMTSPFNQDSLDMAGSC